jgi:uncharacterized protein (TIGR00255 family)
MIRSMTGFGRAEVAGTRMAISVECKSLNHRHLDIALRLPRALSALEVDARRLVQESIHRGRVEVTVSLGPVGGGAPNPVAVNVAQAREYADVARELAGQLRFSEEPTLAWVLAQPGVLSRDEQPALATEEGWPLLAEGLSRALSELLARRAQEGAALAQELAILQEALGAQLALMAERAPATLERRATRLRERIQALLGDATVDETRIATEVAVWADRADISEELARLRAHLDQVAALLAGGGEVGRTLDFLIQEMNREVNTVASKADDLELSQAAIAAKTALEKLREQIQNIE